MRMSIKESGDVYSEAQRFAAVAKNYEEFAAMAWLKFLVEEWDYDHMPSWLTADIMGRNTMGAGVLKEAHRTGETTPPTPRLHIDYVQQLRSYDSARCDSARCALKTATDCLAV